MDEGIWGLPFNEHLVLLWFIKSVLLLPQPHPCQPPPPPAYSHNYRTGRGQGWFRSLQDWTGIKEVQECSDNARIYSSQAWKASVSSEVLKRLKTQEWSSSGDSFKIPTMVNQGWPTMDYYSAIKQNTLDSIDELQNNYAQWKKPDKKEYILYDSIYTHFWKMQTNLWWQKADQCCLG